MIRNMKRATLLIILFCSTYFTTAFAGPEKSDSVKTLEMVSLYRQYVKQNNIPDAINSWRWVFLNAPKFREFTYTDGTGKVVPFMIKNASSDELKEKLIDTLFMVYDQRIQYFQKEGYVSGRKAYDMVRYRPGNSEEILNLFAKSLELQGNKYEYFIISPYFQSMVIAYKKGNKTKEEVLDLYLKFSDVIDINVSGGSKYSSQYTNAKNAIDGDLSGIIESCEEVVELYKPAFDKDPSNEKLWDVVYNIMASKKCYSSTLFSDVATKKFTKAPSADLAHNIALAYQDAGKIKLAIDYFEKAIAQETDPGKQGTYNLELSILVFSKQKNYPKARTYAREAQKLRPDWGLPLIIIGDIYLQSAASFSDEKDKWGAYWASFDKYQKAKSVDPEVTEMAQGKMNTAAAYFPDSERGFFNGLEKGSKFSSSTWIGESTVVRFRN
jgi:tetratricopeptide (TPR) repeat protein